MSVTAEQVQELMGDHSSQYPSPTDPYVWITEYDYQAIADELNAAMVGRGTCEADETETIKCWVKCKDEPSTEHMELIHVMECSECGHTYEHVNGDYEFCPRCGRKRVDA